MAKRQEYSIVRIRASTRKVMDRRQKQTKESAIDYLARCVDEEKARNITAARPTGG